MLNQQNRARLYTSRAKDACLPLLDDGDFIGLWNGSLDHVKQWSGLTDVYFIDTWQRCEQKRIDLGDLVAVALQGTDLALWTE